jgi:predicted CopG family antitoxin
MYVDMNVPGMGTRTIAVSDEVYDRLRALKGEGESFTELLDRLASRPPLSDLATLFSPAEAGVLRRAVQEGRARSRARRERLARP